eukprot:55154-Eustigmatos_ZCMA.PRE.1
MQQVKTRTKGICVTVDCDVAKYGLRLYLNKAGYVVFMSKERKLIYLHRFLCGDVPGKTIYFKDGNRLNCTRANLGVCEQKRGRPPRKQEKKQTSYADEP